MDVGELGCNALYLIYLAQDRDTWRAVTNAVRKHRFLEEWGISCIAEVLVFQRLYTMPLVRQFLLSRSISVLEGLSDSYLSQGCH